MDLRFRLEPIQTEAPPPQELYDVIIVGGGPGGMAAGLYTARAGLTSLLMEREVWGGQAAGTEVIENCPGCLEGSGSGVELANIMRRQATKFGLKFVETEVQTVRLKGKRKILVTPLGEYKARALIITTGANPKKLGVPGEDRFWGRGVSFCSTCDGPLFKGKVIAVVGGGDSAVQEGNYLTRFASRVILVHRRDQLRATKVLQDQAFANPKMEFRWNRVVEEIVGQQVVERVHLREVKTGEGEDLPVDGVFVYIGLIPNTQLFRGVLELDEQGYILTNERMETNIPGVFAAGDVRRKMLRQVVTATSDGAVAATSADEYLSHLDRPKVRA